MDRSVHNVSSKQNMRPGLKVLLEYAAVVQIAAEADKGVNAQQQPTERQNSLIHHPIVNLSSANLNARSAYSKPSGKALRTTYPVP